VFFYFYFYFGTGDSTDVVFFTTAASDFPYTDGAGVWAEGSGEQCFIRDPTDNYARTYAVDFSSYVTANYWYAEPVGKRDEGSVKVRFFLFSHVWVMIKLTACFVYSRFGSRTVTSSARVSTHSSARRWAGMDRTSNRHPNRARLSGPWITPTSCSNAG
jgi:hypothetical protein